MCQYQVRLADGAGRLQQISDLPVGCGLLRCGELRWVTLHSQDVESAQIVNVRSDAVKYLAVVYVLQGQPHQVRVIQLHLPMLGKVADHGVSSDPARNAFYDLVPPGIKVCVQPPGPLPGLVMEGLVSWLLFLQR